MKFMPHRAASARRLIPLILLAYSGLACSQVDTSFEEQFKSIKAPNAAAAIGNDLFGDTLNLYNGALEFRQTDVSVPGNNALPVAIGRRIAAGQRMLGQEHFGKWTLDIPTISGTFPANAGWLGEDMSKNRCSNFGAPPTAVGTNGTSAWDPSEFWHGTMMYIPGMGSQQLLKRMNENQFAPGPVTSFPVVTARFWSLSCIPIKNEATVGALGQGFIAVSPEGTKYYFDWLVNYPALRMTKSDPSAQGVAALLPAPLTSARSADVETAPATPTAIPAPSLVRTEVRLFPSKVVDRFGNTVTYSYDPVKPRNLKSIVASDGRSITLTYNGANQIATVSDGTRKWTYAYHLQGTISNLDKVTLADGSSWGFSAFDPLLTPIYYVNDGGCEGPPGISLGAITGTLTHPSGAAGTFTLTPTHHGRSHIDNGCLAGFPRLATPLFITMMSLTKKTLSGAGFSDMSWIYDYGPMNESWSSCTSCISNKTVTVTDPASQVSRFTFGNEHDVNEGRIELTETGWNGSSALRSTVHKYPAFGAGPYPHYMGSPNNSNMGDGDFNARLAPESERVTTQQGETFTWRVNAFDTRARPTSVTRQSSLGLPRTELSSYEDAIAGWVMGPLKSMTETSTNRVTVLNEYDLVTGTLRKVSSFGLVTASMDYLADGTLSVRRDGKNQATTYTNFYRGIPRNVKYADLSTESYVVSNIGKITSKTDQNGFSTDFAYDAIGRVKTITPPIGDTVVWNATSVIYEFVPTAEYSLPAGHWRQTITAGTKVDVNIFDALMRPYYTSSSDINTPATTSRFVAARFDFAGKNVFTSYPQRTVAEISGGTHTEYDALGRTVAVHADSELGLINTSRTYGSGFSTTSVDGRGKSSTSSFQVFDEPVESAIVKVVAPEGVTVDIARDIFGKPTAITRSGGGKSATRSYVYDNGHRLCKTIEPETGAAVLGYDLANNVVMRANGLALLSTTTCDNTGIALASQITLGYDVLNRLTTTSYGDQSPAIARTYWPDGLLKTVNSGGANWTYAYNRLRAPITESLAYGGGTYTLTNTYDANGALTHLKYPDNTVIAYAPNAMGEPTQVGTYATGITYYPNGAIKGFTYGNGIVHTLAQNLRGLPERSADVGVMSDGYTFDQNANVKSIKDWQQGVTTRTMEYDDLDRLKIVNAPAVWGDALYNYDALDNITTSNLTGGPGIARTMVHQYDVKNRLSNITGNAGFAFSYGYDNFGNITSRGSQIYGFDMGNRMKSAAGKGTYLYDGLGRRMSVVGPDAVNRVSVYSQAGKLLYVTPTGGAGTKYIYLHTHQIAKVNP